MTFFHLSYFKIFLSYFVSLINKDSANLSEKQYEKISKVTNLPSLYYLNKFKKDMDNTFKINENSLGFFNDAIEKISNVIKNIIKTSQIQNFEEIKIKIGMDGIQLTKTNRQILNVTFTVINENKRATTSKGNYLIGKFCFD